MARIWSKLARARKLTFRQWTDIGRAANALLMARLRFARFSAKELVAYLEADQTKDAEAPGSDTTDPVTAAYLARLDFSIRAAAGVVPWRSDCLIRCLAAKSLLLRRGLVPVFRIGVRKTETGDLAAHAWTYCQGVPIAGGDGTGFEVLIGPAQD